MWFNMGCGAAICFLLLVLLAGFTGYWIATEVGC
jgi:hypothetical protein